MTQFNAEELLDEEDYLVGWGRDGEGQFRTFLSANGKENWRTMVDKLNQAYLRGAEDAKADSYTAGYNKAIEDAVGVCEKQVVLYAYRNDVHADEGHDRCAKDCTQAISKLKKG